MLQSFKKIMKAIILLYLLLSCSSQNKEKTWNLVWSDEFNYNGLPDEKKWICEEGFVRNSEPQYYTKERLQNCRVADGNLIITAYKEDYKGAKYTSASINTKGIYGFTQGRVEVRAKLPSGRGVWPAIWTVGTNSDQVGWPSCGEIDIMEYWGHDPNDIHANVHTVIITGQKEMVVVVISFTISRGRISIFMLSNDTPIGLISILMTQCIILVRRKEKVSVNGLSLRLNIC